MATTLEEWQETVEPMLAGINAYNPENIETLEQYIEFQAQNEVYDFEANLILMKLYQFQPSRSNVSVATQMLLKALANMPNTDFVLLKCVLSQSLQKEENIQQILQLHSLLESCQFKEFWQAARENQSLIQLVVGFEATVRKYICSIVDVSYQTISLVLLKEYLGEIEGSIFDDVVSSRSWQVSGDTVHVQNHEEHIKPKKILAKIELDSVSGILAAAAAR